jgi:hypothetical protein
MKNICNIPPMLLLIGMFAFGTNAFAQATTDQATATVDKELVNTGMTLAVGAGDYSDTFHVKAGFTGHVYIHGYGGNQQAVFLVGSDGDANFVGSGGVSTRLFHYEMKDVRIEYVEKLTWRIAGIPQFGGAHSKVTVGLVGVAVKE